MTTMLPPERLQERTDELRERTRHLTRREREIGAELARAILTGEDAAALSAERARIRREHEDICTALSVADAALGAAEDAAQASRIMAR